MVKTATETPDTLNERMSFDHVIVVNTDGTVTDSATVYAPELHDGEVGPGWTLLNGYSGQWSYSGPIMHASEFIGGRMARDILAEPGIYVALVDYPTDDSEPDGWAVARKDDTVDCRWFAMCPNTATGYLTHPMTGDVPTCDRCHRIGNPSKTDTPAP